MSHSDDNQDWDFSDSEEDYRNESEGGKPAPTKGIQQHTSSKREDPLSTPVLNEKKSALQELVESNEQDYDRRPGDRRRGGGGRDRGDRGDREYRRGGGGYRDRDRGDRRGPRPEKEFSNYSSMVD